MRCLFCNGYKYRTNRFYVFNENWVAEENIENVNAENSYAFREISGQLHIRQDDMLDCAYSSFQFMGGINTIQQSWKP